MTVDYLFPPYTRDGCELCQLSRRQRDQEIGVYVEFGIDIEMKIGQGDQRDYQMWL